MSRLDGQTSPDQVTSGTTALEDVVVVDLARVLAGPYATMLLADLGARVIKVERPGDGDDTRAWGPPFVGPEGHQESTYFLSVNRNKESIVLDLRTRADRELLAQLLRRADVLVENFRPGVIDGLGFGYAAVSQLNPRLVMLSISGFGAGGPDADRPGYDQIIQGEAGLMSLTGDGPEHPTRVGVPISDVLTGVFGALGVITALRVRDRTGRGQLVTASLLASSVAAHAFQATKWLIGGELPVAEGNHHPTIVPYGTFRSRDGWVQLAVGNDTLWQRFAPLMGIDPDDPSFDSNASRFAHRTRLVELIEEALSAADVDTWLATFRGAGIPAGRVNSLDKVYASEQVRSQRLTVEVDHPTLGPIQMPGPGIRLTDGMRPISSHPPLLDEHAEAIRRWLATTSGEAGGADLGLRDLLDSTITTAADRRETASSNSGTGSAHAAENVAPDGATRMRRTSRRTAATLSQSQIGGFMEQTTVLEPASGAAFELPSGGRFRITDLKGHQVSDLVAFPMNDLHDRFSPGNTRKLNNSLLLTTGSVLYSTKCNALLRIAEDSVGCHDITSSWCNPYDYPIRFGVTDHPSCLAILTRELSSFGVDESMIPEPFNVFMKTRIDPDSGAIEVAESPASAGDSILFEAVTDCLVAMTVCPQDKNACNGWEITPLQLDITNPER